MEPIVSLDKIRTLAQAAAHCGKSVADTNPYQVMVGKKYIGFFADQQAAEEAYRYAVSVHLEGFLS